MKYAIIGLGLAALVVGCNQESNSWTPAAGATTVSLTCMADGGVSELNINTPGQLNLDAYKTIPDWAAKACGPIRKATYPPPTPPASASNDSCWDAKTQKVTDGPCGGTHMTPFVNPYDHMGENGTPG